MAFIKNLITDFAFTLTGDLTYTQWQQEIEKKVYSLQGLLSSLMSKGDRFGQIQEQIKKVNQALSELSSPLSVELFVGDTRGCHQMNQIRVSLLNLWSRLLLLLDKIEDTRTTVLFLETIHKIMSRSEFDSAHLCLDDMGKANCRMEYTHTFRRYRQLLMNTHMLITIRLADTKPMASTSSALYGIELPQAYSKVLAVNFFRLPEVGFTITECLSEITVSYRLSDYEEKHDEQSREQKEKKKEKRRNQRLGLLSSKAIGNLRQILGRHIPTLGKTTDSLKESVGEKDQEKDSEEKEPELDEFSELEIAETDPGEVIIQEQTEISEQAPWVKKLSDSTLEPEISTTHVESAALKETTGAVGISQESSETKIGITSETPLALTPTSPVCDPLPPPLQSHCLLDQVALSTFSSDQVVSPTDKDSVTPTIDNSTDNNNSYKNISDNNNTSSTEKTEKTDSTSSTTSTNSTEEDNATDIDEELLDWVDIPLPNTNFGDSPSQPELTDSAIPEKEKPEVPSLLTMENCKRPQRVKSSEPKNSTDERLAKHEIKDIPIDEASSLLVMSSLPRLFSWPHFHSAVQLLEHDPNRIETPRNSGLVSSREVHLGTLTENKAWTNWFTSRSLLFIFMVSELVEHVEKIMNMPLLVVVPAKTVVKVVPKSNRINWRAIEGISQIIDTFLYILQHSNMTRHIFICSITLLHCEPLLINYYLRSLLSRTASYNLSEVLAAMTKIHTWFQEFKDMNCFLPTCFDVYYFCDAIDAMLDTDHHQIINRCLQLLYDVSDVFTGEIRKQLISEFLLKKYFFHLFLHWDEITRNYFHQFLIFKAVRVKRSQLHNGGFVAPELPFVEREKADNLFAILDPESELNNDHAVYAKIQCYVQVVQDQLRDPKTQGYDKNLESYAPKAMSEYRYYLSKYHTWESELTGKDWKLVPLTVMEKKGRPQVASFLQKNVD